MKLYLNIAWRYIKAKKTHNIINVISAISIVGVAIGTMALVIVLSVFNGFESLVVSLYNTFDPDIKIMPHKGKTIDIETVDWSIFRKYSEIHKITQVLEDKSLLVYNENQYLATLKGVDSTYESLSTIDSSITEGVMLLQQGYSNYAVLGQGVAYNLDIDINNYNAEIEAYAPKQNIKAITNLNNSFNILSIRPSGVFSIQQEFDMKYVYVPLIFAQQLFESEGKISYIELRLNDKVRSDKIKKKLVNDLGDRYIIKSRDELQETLHKIMQSEKWAIFFILTFILIIATFNIIGTLSILILDKKEDINILHSLGANKSLIKKIFFSEGIIISLIGVVSGLIIGLTICLIQQQFGLIKLNAASGTFLIDSYPVKIIAADMLKIVITVVIIGLISALIPVVNINKIKN